MYEKVETANHDIISRGFFAIYEFINRHINILQGVMHVCSDKSFAFPILIIVCVDI